MDVKTIGGMDLNAAASKVAQSLTSGRAVRSAAQPSGTNGTPTGTPTTTTTGATITSNDFLRLLVTEMKNQDPTQPTDPNAYIQQLVGVNSLQQLIAINKDLTPTPVTSPVIGKV